MVMRGLREVQRFQWALPSSLDSRNHWSETQNRHHCDDKRPFALHRYTPDSIWLSHVNHRSQVSKTRLSSRLTTWRRDFLADESFVSGIPMKALLLRTGDSISAVRECQDLVSS